jgi:aspartyl-tRNA synthetase
MFSGKTSKAVAVNNCNKPRSFIDKDLIETAKNSEIETVYWFKIDENGSATGGISKFISDVEAFKKTLSICKNSFVAIVAGENEALTLKQAGIVRTILGNGLDLIDKNVYRFCWIVDFPMYELDDDGKVAFSHNPFSMPQGGMSALKKKKPLDILAYQYDLVCNGIELSSGAVRNHDPEIMVQAFKVAGYGKEAIEEKFSALYNAFKFGAPPHAGIAPGVDRMVMLLADEPNIREVIAFPMNKNAKDLLMGAPGTVTDKQLDEANIAVKPGSKFRE